MATSTTKEIRGQVRVRAFSCESAPQLHLVLVEGDGDVLVWDDVAGHYTRCHSLTPSQAARIRRKLRKGN